MRALGARSVHAIFLRRGIFSAFLSAGAFRHDALSPPGGRAGTGNFATGNAGSSAPRWSAERESDGSGSGGHHGAGESDRPSDRARVAADGHRAVGRASEEKRIAFAAVLRAGGTACGDEDRTVPARAAKEVCEEAGEIHARAAAAFTARHKAQDGGFCLSGKASEATGDRAG